MPDNKALEPFVGPQPFGREDAWRFFGRGDIADEVFSLLLSSRSLLLYSQSGAGKTSLVNAGLLPLAEEEGFDVLPPARVRGVLPDRFGPDGMGNPYTFFTLASLDPGGAAAHYYRSVADWLRTRPRPPERFGEPVPRLIVLDQFEELFTSLPAHWEQRPGLVEDLGRALVDDPFLHVVFCLREDYLADMLSLAKALPDQLRTQFRLSRLSYDEAVSAVEGPVTTTGATFDDGVVARLVTDLMQVRVETMSGTTTEVRGEFVEPVQLQVVCSSLWASLPPSTTVITDEHVRQFGDVSSALARFYDEAVAETALRTGILEGVVRSWFESALITPANTRGMAYQGKESTAGLDNEAVAVLENRHMVRAEVRAGSRWYELTHDRFIGPIQASNARARDIEAASRRHWGAGVLLVVVVGVVVLAVFGSHRGPAEAAVRFALAAMTTVAVIQLGSTELDRPDRPRRFLSWVTRLPGLVAGLLLTVGSITSVTVEPLEGAAPFSDYVGTYAPDLQPPSYVTCGGSALKVFVDGPSPDLASDPQPPQSLESLESLESTLEAFMDDLSDLVSDPVSDRARLESLARAWCAEEASIGMTAAPAFASFAMAMSFLGARAFRQRRRARRARTGRGTP